MFVPGCRGIASAETASKQMDLSVAERPRARQRTMTVNEFCALYGVGRSKAYEEINSGRLRARKAGKRTIVGGGDAETWFASLPVIGDL
jgi:excisionase family DNA binding protein